MKQVRLIHWNAEEAEEKALKIRSAGYAVRCEPFDRDVMDQMRKAPPAVVVIDLNRRPAQGRDVGLLVRKYKDTRCVPIVFVEGTPEKRAGIEKVLPDAFFTTWKRIRSALKEAVAKAPSSPEVPESIFAPYAGTPLFKKLGIKEGALVALKGAPADLSTILGDLPKGVRLRKEIRSGCDLILWFTRSKKELERRIKMIGSKTGRGGLWVIWPKKASGVKTDLTQVVVRKVGLDSGLVDYKVCSVDKVWTGLKFARRDSRQ